MAVVLMMTVMTEEGAGIGRNKHELPKIQVVAIGSEYE